MVCHTSSAQHSSARGRAGVCLILFLLFAGAAPAKAAESGLSDESSLAGELAAAVLRDLSGDTCPGASGTAPAQRQGNSFISYVSKKWTGDFDGMRERRMIRALVVYSRTHFFLANGTKRGLTYDALIRFEKDLNSRLHTKKSDYIHVVFVPVRRDEILQALRDGRGDIAAADLTVTAAGRQLADFTRPVLSNVRSIVVTAPGGPAVAGIGDLAGKQIYVRASSSCYEHLAALNRDFGTRGLAPMEIITTPDQLGEEDLLEMVNAGLMPMTVADSHLAHYWARFFDNMTVHTDLAVNTGGQIAWAVRKNSPRLKALADDYLRRNLRRWAPLQEGSRTAQGDSLRPREATAGQDMERFRKAVSIFKKYGKRYKFDYLLLAAQGYQESGLDQRRRSRAGAVGVMQVMPQTGRELGFGDISGIDSNIHAGTKYMRMLMDGYFADAAFDDLNRSLFAFASYNAGPNRIAALRKAAGRRGYDPNVWFGNVEHVVAEQVGQEPVLYVGNIFKYYVAYKLSEKQQAEHTAVKADTQKALHEYAAWKSWDDFFTRVAKKIL
jgi:membrane-bound lytic murein transglycosylase MltF